MLWEQVLRNFRLRRDQWNWGGLHEDAGSQLYQDGQESHRQREMGRYMQGSVENKDADEGLWQAGAEGREQTLLAEAELSCRGDMVRFFSPTEQVHSRNSGQKEMLPFYCLLDPSHPGISFLLGVGMDFIHLRTSRWSADQKHSSLLICNFPSNELLKGNNWWLLILQKTGWGADETVSYLKEGSHKTQQLRKATVSGKYLTATFPEELWKWVRSPMKRYGEEWMEKEDAGECP